jgi:hypothetical protein
MRSFGSITMSTRVPFQPDRCGTARVAPGSSDQAHSPQGKLDREWARLGGSRVSSGRYGLRGINPKLEEQFDEAAGLQSGHSRQPCNSEGVLMPAERRE